MLDSVLSHSFDILSPCSGSVKIKIMQPHWPLRWGTSTPNKSWIERCGFSPSFCNNGNSVGYHNTTNPIGILDAGSHDVNPELRDQVLVITHSICLEEERDSSLSDSGTLPSSQIKLTLLALQIVAIGNGRRKVRFFYPGFLFYFRPWYHFVCYVAEEESVESISRVLLPQLCHICDNYSMPLSLLIPSHLFH